MEVFFSSYILHLVNTVQVQGDLATIVLKYPHIKAVTVVFEPFQSLPQLQSPQAPHLSAVPPDLATDEEHLGCAERTKGKYFCDFKAH